MLSLASLRRLHLLHSTIAMQSDHPALAPGEESAAPPAPDPNALVYHPCEGGCGTTLACSPYAGPIRPPFRCVRCTAGKPAWEQDPPYILAPGDLVPVEVEAAREYLRDADGIPLPGQVVPLNLAAYLAQDRPLDKHLVMTMLVEFAVRKEAGELAWQLLHTLSAEHRGDERLAPIAVGWVTQRALENRFDYHGDMISLVHRFAAAGDVSKLTSLVSAGLPAWKMLVAKSSDGWSPLSSALVKGPANLPAVTTFFLDAARWLGGPHPLPLTPEMADAAGELPEVLSRAMNMACVYNRVPEVAQLLACPGVDPTWNSSMCLQNAAQLGYTPIVQLLLADGRADPGAYNQFAIHLASENGHTDTVAALLGDPRVDPTASNGRALKWALKNRHAAVAALLKADPRMAPWAHLAAESPGVVGFYP